MTGNGSAQCSTPPPHACYPGHPLLQPPTFAGLLRHLREQRPSFRTFSSGGGGGSGSSGGGGGGSGGGGGGGGFGLWVTYLALLEKQPVATKAVSAALLNGMGDAIAQTQFEEGPFDWKRCGIFTLLVRLVGGRVEGGC